MPTLEQVTEYIRATYHAIWTEWYAGRPPVRAADLVIAQESCNAHYSLSRDQISIPVLEGNLDTSDVLDSRLWPPWMIDLVEEMLHEYVTKVDVSPTPEGAELCRKYAHTCDGEGHDERFFTALAEKAGSLGVSADSLARCLAIGTPPTWATPEA